MGRKILIVADEEKFCANLQKSFEKEGYEIQVEMKAEQAFEKVRAFRPEVFIIDVTKPEGNCDAVNKIKAEPKFSKILVLFVSGLASKNESEIYCGLIDGSPFNAFPVFKRSDKAKDLIKYIEEKFAPPPEGGNPAN